MTTDYSCTPCLHRRCSIDLSSFRQLRSLTWKAPNPIHLDALFVAIRANSVHLQTLELDFVNWEDTWDFLASDNAGDHEDTAAQNFLVQGLLGPDRRLTPLVLPDIRTLVLSQVPVTASLAKMISFESLVSLTLRNCPGWDTFLARAARLKCRIQLTTFELHSETVSPLWTQNTLVEFLGAFRGLEELFVSQAGPVDSLALWDCIACHKSTLKRLVQQQSAINTEMMAPYFEGAHVIWDRAIFGRGARDMRDDACQSPFAQLELEYVGIGYAPERLVSLKFPKSLAH